MSEKSIRSIGSATINFGLVSAPIKLYSATDTTAKISFNQLHQGCGGRIRQSLYCEKDNKPIDRTEIVKGYEFAKDTYVQFSADEIKSLEEKNSYSIDITEFVGAEQVDPIYFDKSYYVAPNRGGARAYSLLVEALKRCNRVGIAKWASRGKDYTVMIRPFGLGMVMHTLCYNTEIRNIKDVPLDLIEPKEAEVNLALQLIGTLSHHTFDPSKYKDSVHERMESAIDAKLNGKAITVQEEAPKSQIVDIMAALQASLGMMAQKQA